MFVLVRHARAGDKDRWDGDDALRPLSWQGRRQAAGLVAPLVQVGAGRLLSSPYLRCTETLQPLADATGLDLATSDLLRPEADAHELDRLVADPGMDGTVYCTHGETLTALFTLWRAIDPDSDPRARTGRTGTAKGAAWLIDTGGGHPRSMTYLRPAPPGRRGDVDG